MNDVLLSPPPPPSPRQLASLRSVLQAELQRPRVSWRRRASLVVLASVGVGLLVLVGALTFSLTDASVVRGHLPTVFALALGGPVLVYVAARPRPAPAWWGWLIPLAAATLMVVLRGDATDAGQTPEWLCTVSHLGAGLPAMVTAAVLLRTMAFDGRKAVMLGLAAGVTGALIGEVMCGRSGLHASLFHLSAWAVVTAVTVAVARRATPRSFAP